MGNLVVSNPALSGAMAKYMASKGLTASTLSQGITSGFGIISYRGKTWAFKYRGEEQVQVRKDDGTPKAALDLVIIDASPYVSKIFYKDGYIEGSTEAPDCFSVDGVRPDAAAPRKQGVACATCPMNAWGSKVTPAGKQSKACTDSKRLAVIPTDELLSGNPVFGGPMLLRVPAATLSDLAQYDSKLGAAGFPFFAVATDVRFDMNESYPKFVLSATRALTDAECEKVIEYRESDQVKRMLTAVVEVAQADVATPATAGAPAVTPTVTPQPVQQPVQHPTQVFQQPVQQVQQPVQQPASVFTQQPDVTATQPQVAHPQVMQAASVFTQPQQPVQQVQQPANPAPIQQAQPQAAVFQQPATTLPVAQSQPLTTAAASAGGVDANIDGVQAVNDQFANLLDGLLSTPNE